MMEGHLRIIAILALIMLCSRISSGQILWPTDMHDIEEMENLDDIDTMMQLEYGPNMTYLIFSAEDDGLYYFQDLRDKPYLITTHANIEDIKYRYNNKIDRHGVIWREDLDYLGPNLDVEKLRKLNIGYAKKYLTVEVSGNLYRIEYLTNTNLINTNVSIEDIQYHFYGMEDQYGGTIIEEGQLGNLTTSNFNVSKDTFILIHGWTNNYLSEGNLLIKEALLKYDVNVIVVDWSAISHRNYTSAKLSTTKVGKRVASFISSLVDTFKLELSSVTIVGYSLGAHVAGSTGAALKGQINQIVGLDPALALYDYFDIKDRLDPSDAQFVQVIHTSGMRLGFYLTMGHTDYYPNGGMEQPGCYWIDIADGVCSHCRSYQLYAESIAASRNLFVAIHCSTYAEFALGLCAENPRSVMGGYNLDTMARGTYFLNTAGIAPYALG